MKIFKKKDKKISKEIINFKLTSSLKEKIDNFKDLFKNDETIIFREIENYQNHYQFLIIYINGMIDNQIVNDNLLYPLMNIDFNVKNENKLLETIESQIINITNINKTKLLDEMLQALFSGHIILFDDYSEEGLIIKCDDIKSRSITEPEYEKTIIGPKEGFTESLITNLSLIRKIIKTPDLKINFQELGKRTRTQISICYLDSIANSKILSELENRLSKIDIDGILDSNYILESITDSPFSPLKTIGITERPDTVVAKLLEGKFAVFVDGTPAVLTLPFLFIENFHNAEDYYVNFLFSSFNRVVRIIASILTISIPAIYISLVAFHHEMIPTPLLLSINAARQGVPFPSIVEVLLLLFAFEIVREAGARMPTTMGQSISIVGALILGQASVQARIFSAPVVIVVALTGISGLISKKIQSATIIFRIILLFLSAIIGLYGFVFGVFGILIYIMSIRSFGIPYIIQSSNFINYDLHDTAIRAPWWSMKYRPKFTGAKNMIRQKVKKGHNHE